MTDHRAEAFADAKKALEMLGERIISLEGELDAMKGLVNDGLDALDALREVE